MEGRPVTGAVWGARIVLIGQAPGPREEVQRRPFAWTAGRRLFSWFEGLGISEERFREEVHIAAVTRCFPGRSASGGDRVPDPQEIRNCSVHLDAEVSLLRPGLLIAVGSLAAAELLGEGSLSSVVGRLHRRVRAGVELDVVVLPHPSGRSTWLNELKHRRLFERSLKLIARHPSFRETFGRANGSLSADSGL